MAAYGGLLHFIGPGDFYKMPYWEVWFWWRALVEYQKEITPKEQ